VDDIRDRLAHILWIGGGPRVGKTTLSRLLAGKWDLKIYNLDWHQVREHRNRPGGIPRSWDTLSMDARWLTPSPEELAERDAAGWTAGFALVVEDLLALPRSRIVVAEGPGVFPWCVASTIRSANQAIFLVPSVAFRDSVLARRARDVPVGQRMEDETSDPERARRNLRDRDVALGARVASSCAELGLRCVRVDGSLDLDDSLTLVEEHFRPYLPAIPNV